MKYILNDEFSNRKSNVIPYNYVNKKLYEQNYFYDYEHPSEESKEDAKKGDIFLSDTDSFDGEINKLISKKIRISSGNRGQFLAIRISPDEQFEAEFDVKMIIEPNYYFTDIYKITDEIEKVYSYINDYYKEIYTESYEKYYIVKSNEYIGVYGCINYEKCNTVKKLVENIVNQK